MNVTRMRTLLRERGPLAVPVVAGYFALRYARRNKTKTAAMLTLGAGGLALFSHCAGTIPEPDKALRMAYLKAAPDAAAYNVTDLGTLGGRFSLAESVNNRGQVAGYSLTRDGEGHGFVWNGGKMTGTGTLGGIFSFADAVNSSGVAVGCSTRSEDDEYLHAFAWRDGKIVKIEPKGEVASLAFGINDSGAMVGLTMDANEKVCGLIRKGDAVRKFSFAGSDFTVACAINAGGSVAGYGLSGGKMQSFTMNEGKFRTLPGLRGEDCFAEAINERGDAAGASFLDDSDTLHAVVWRDGKPNDLGTLPGLPDSLALAVNRDGAAVGGAFPPDGENFKLKVAYGENFNLKVACDLLEKKRHHFRQIPDFKHSFADFLSFKYPDLTIISAYQTGGFNLGAANESNNSDIPHAFVWRNGKITDLNTLLPPGSGWNLAIASGINDNGQICGLGLHDGKVRAFLLNPK